MNIPAPRVAGFTRNGKNKTKNQNWERKPIHYESADTAPRELAALPVGLVEFTCKIPHQTGPIVASRRQPFTIR